MPGEPSNQTLKSMIDDMQRTSNERHADYKEERKNVTQMLEKIEAKIDKMVDKHDEMEKIVLSLASWSVEAKKVIEANSQHIGSLQKRDYMVMGGVAVLMTVGSVLATLFIKDIVQTEIEKNNIKLEKLTEQASINALDRKASSVTYEESDN